MEFEDRVPFVVRLEAEDRQALFRSATPLAFSARQVLLREHEPTAHVLILLSGWTKVTSAAANGYEALLALRGPGDIVGEAAVLSGRPRGATVTALGQVETLALDADRFSGLLDERPAISRKLLALTADRMRDSDRRRVQYAALNVQERLALLLLELIRSHGEEAEDGVQLTPGLTQSELAGSVGASREAVARLLKGLRERGIVRTGRRGLVVMRPDVLRRMARQGDR
ncbi:cyclic nucleotide-binding domain-containing protein [Streptomyces sp. NRRL B-1677]|uniref:Crp/Fnr family transcriptional regulator n=1 Tax=Streptomyces klenkii TaxID=1420899 RepID=A0A3B0BAN3_9ACTN|nr:MULTISPECIES: Crp/Fnr family transcriptional regulator [Streptomyces]MBF6044442.1 cyclic nucleotide-binding domain-containing protein [Streptomyces sp. NRRL B-1677]RKN69992.1 Crp/Fnr family transcriptional regulator [Streptomyces klenkii]